MPYFYFRSEAYHLKECKEPCVASNQGPDIIPEKSFFQGNKIKYIFIMNYLALKCWI